MFKIKTIAIFALDILLMVQTFILRSSPRADEYLVLFLIPLLSLVAPYFLDAGRTAALLTVNFIFFVVCSFRGVFNPIDATFFIVIILSASGVSRLLILMAESVRKRDNEAISKYEAEYNEILRKLEGVERKARIVESELVRISRLYEITKQLGAVLKFDDFIEVLFDFLEKNFKFEKAHLLLVQKDRVTRIVLKDDSGIKEMNENDSGADGLDYSELLKSLKEASVAPFYLEREVNAELFRKLNILTENVFFVFPVSLETFSAVLVIEGATKQAYNRFAIIVPQLAMELRRVELYERIEELSIIDGLTGTYLRRYLTDRLEEEMDRTKRLNLRFSIAMVDVDHFKRCNDTYGHLVGDAVLKEIAGRLLSSVREVDLIARYGGEEFCVLLPETGKELATTVAERLRKAVEAKDIRAYDAHIRATVSVGIATFPEDGLTINGLIDKADSALYMAKGRGRNQVMTA
ncbi:MAG: GGDEF domain-containing protein [Candidatus Omnitrophica bacterium]|nr:GGDEF domain-containing protein [Candidatus Omnitrophota bacterium]